MSLGIIVPKHTKCPPHKKGHSTQGYYLISGMGSTLSHTYIKKEDAECGIIAHFVVLTTLSQGRVSKVQSQLMFHK